MAVDVERGEQGHELLFISAPEAEQHFIKNVKEGGGGRDDNNQKTKAPKQLRRRRQEAWGE